MVRALSAAKDVAAALCLLSLLLGQAACGKSTPTSPSTWSSPPGSSDPLPGIEGMLAAKVLGNPDATISMIEYSSLTCSYCAGFHAETLPLIKEHYIDTGKVALIYRDFPADNGAALSASIVARCSGDRFFSVLDHLYRTQATWAGSANVTSALASAVAPFGMTTAEVSACLSSTELRSGIVAMRAQGQAEHSVWAVPTFVINGQRIEGAQPYASFAAVIDSLLQ